MLFTLFYSIFFVGFGFAIEWTSRPRLINTQLCSFWINIVTTQFIGKYPEFSSSQFWPIFARCPGELFCFWSKNKSPWMVANSHGAIQRSGWPKMTCLGGITYAILATWHPPRSLTMMEPLPVCTAPCWQYGCIDSWYLFHIQTIPWRRNNWNQG